MARSKLKVGNIQEVSGEVNIAAGDIIKNIKTIHQRALTAAEEAAHARKLESKLLAQGIATLVQNLSAQASEGAQSESPYKGLLPYSLNEAEIFHGRNKAKKDLLAHIKQSPLTVLHAESGAGKSSLLQAGIAAQLIANGNLAVYLRPYHADPVEFIKRMFLPELTQAPVLADAPLREFLRQVCTVLGPKVNLYLLLDQFEEFFQLKKEERQPFLESLADCLNDPSLKVRWVLALRKEALSDLAELELFGITQFKNTYRLDRLSRAEAQAAMVEPARRYGITFEPALTEHILDTLTSNDEIRPTHLQLVCYALTNDLPEEKTLTLAYYTEQEGGTEGILRDYLKRQLEDLPASEQILAWKVLRVLITADRHRAVKTNDEIVQELKTSGASKKQIETVLGRLVERRLLFTQTQPATEEMFELAHDYLIKEIELDPQEQALKAAQELLDQEARTYQRHKTLLTAELLAVIQPYQNELNFSAEAKALLSESQKAVQEEKYARERRRNITLGISVAVAIGMSLLAFWGFRSSEDAKREANISLARQLAAQAKSIASTNIHNQATADLLAVLSLKLYPSNTAIEVLHSSTLAYPVLHLRDVSSFGFTSDSRHVLAFSCTSSNPDGSCTESSIQVWETTTGNEKSHLLLHNIGLGGFSANGNYAVLLENDKKSVQILEISTGATIMEQELDFEAGSVSLSPDAKYLLLASHDFDFFELWRISTGERIAHILHHHSYTPFGYAGNSVVFSPDGKYLGLGDEDGILRVFLTETGKEISNIQTEDMILAVSFEEGNDYVATGGGDETARVWNISTGEEVSNWTQDGDVQVLAFSHSGEFVLSGNGWFPPLLRRNYTARLWSADYNAVISERAFDTNVSAVAISADSNYVAAGSSDGSAHIWDARTGEETGVLVQDEPIAKLDFSPNGEFIVSAGSLSTFVWKIFSQEPMMTLTYDEPIWPVEISPDEKYVAVGSTGGHDTPIGGMVRVLERGTGHEVFSLMTELSTISSISFSPDSQYIFVSSLEDRSILVLNTTTGEQIASLTHDGLINSIDFSLDGKYVASGSDDGTARVWESATGTEVSRMTSDPKVYSVRISPNNDYVVSGDCQQLDGRNYCRQGVARTWKLMTGEEITHTSYQGPVYAIALSPNSRYVASAGCDQLDAKYERCLQSSTRVWEIETGKEVSRTTYQGPVYTVDFDAHSKYVVASGCDQADSNSQNCLQSSVSVWEVESGKQISRTTYQERVYSVGLDAKSDYMVSTGCDQYDENTELCLQTSARLQQLETGQEIARIAYQGTWPSVAFTADGKYMVTAGCDQLDVNSQECLQSSTRVWDVGTVEEVARRIDRGSTFSADFSPDGKYVISIHGDGSAHIWLWSSKDLIEATCARLTRNLTPAEWQQYIGDAVAYPASSNDSICPNLPTEPEPTPTPSTVR